MACATGPRPVQARAAGAEAAWAELWRDDFAAAERDFRALASAGRGDAEARRGLALALLAQGAEAECLKELEAAEDGGAFAPAIRRLEREVLPDGLAARNRYALRCTARSSAQRADLDEREALDYLVDFYLFSKTIVPAAPQYLAALGALPRWRLLGPFPNPSGSAFPRDFLRLAVEADGAKDVRYLRDDGTKPAWGALRPPSADGVVRPAAFLGTSAYGSLYYALSSTKLSKTGEYRLIVERRGRAEVRLDGEVVLSDPIERAGGEYRSARIKLSAGAHDVLVKLGADVFQDPYVRVSLVRAEGGAEVEAAAAAALAGLAGAAPGDANDALAAVLSASAADGAEGRFWRALALLASGYGEAALGEVGAARVAGATDSALFDYLEARCLASLGRRPAARAALLRPADRHSLFAPSLQASLERDIAERRLAEARDTIGRAADLTRWPGLALYEVALAAAEGRDVRDALSTFAKAWPDSPLAAQCLVARGGALGVGHYDLIAALEKKGQPAEAARLRMEASYMAGAFSAARSWAEKILWVRGDEARTWFVKARSGMLSGNANYAEIEKEIEEYASIFPGSMELAELRAAFRERAYEAARRVENAVLREPGEKPVEKERRRLADALDSLIALDPLSYGLRARQREILGMADLDGRAAETSVAMAVEEYERDRDPATAAREDAEIAAAERTTVFLGRGLARTYRFFVVKLLSRAGVERERSQYLEGAEPEVDQAFALKPSGERRQAIVGERSVTFPGLEAGDYLVLRYAADEPYVGGPAGGYWTDERLQSLYPCFRRTLRFVFPEADKLAVKLHGAEGLSIKREEGEFEAGMRQIAITGSRLPGLGVGRYMADYRDVGAWVDLSSVRDWEAVADWYRNLYSNRAAPSFEVREKAEALVAGLADEEARIGALYDFAANGIAYADLDFQYSAFVPKRARETLADGTGDCKDKSTLLVALLAAAGIKSHIALSAPDYRGPAFFLPSPRFSHAVVVVPRERGDLVLDPTAANLTYPNLPAALPGTWHLGVGPGGTGAVATRLPASPPSAGTVFQIEAALEAGRIAVKGTAAFRGDLAYEVRTALASRRPDLQEESVAELMAEALPGLRLGAWKASGIEQAGKGADPTLEFSGELPAPAVQGGVASLDLPWAPRLPASLMLPSTPGPGPVAVDLWRLQAPLRQTVVVRMPAGARPLELPKDVRLEFGNAYAIFSYAISGRNLVCIRELYVPPLEARGEEREAFAAFVTRVSAKVNEAVLIALP